MGTINKHRINVTLYWNSLQRDVENKAWRMAKLTKLGIDLNTKESDNRGDKAETEINLTDEDRSILQREMRTALADIVNMCHEYIWSNSHSSDNKTIAASDVTLILLMPSNWNLAGCAALGPQMHAYLVAKALTAWFMLTAITDKQINALNEQKQNVASARLEIESILGRRVRVMRGGQSLHVIVGDETPETPVYSYYYTFATQAATNAPSQTDLTGTNSTQIPVTAGNNGKHFIFGVISTSDIDAFTQDRLAIAPPKTSFATSTINGRTYRWYNGGTVNTGNIYLEKGKTALEAPIE